MTQKPETQIITASVPIRHESDLPIQTPLHMAYVSLDNEIPTNTAIFSSMGIVSEGLVGKTAARAAATGSEYGKGLLVIGAPEYHKLGDPKHIEDSAVQFGQQALEIAKNEGLLAPDADVAAHSQQVALVATLLRRQPEIFTGAVALANGLGSAALKGQIQLVRRLVRSTGPIYLDMATHEVSWNVTKQFAADKFRLGSQLTDWVLQYSMWKDVVEALAANPDMDLSIVAGEGDKTFREKDVAAAATQAQAEAAQSGKPLDLLGRIVTQKGGHWAWATKKGAEQMVEVNAHMKSGGNVLPPMQRP